jgi:hypothetical protein
MEVPVTALASFFSVMTLGEPTPGQRAAAWGIWAVSAIVVLVLLGLVIFGLWQLMELAAPLVN